MATKVHMEALSPTMEEGQLVKWLKHEGDAVDEGDVLAEIETDKATMELVARGSGVLQGVKLKEGDTAPVGEVIAVIAAEGEAVEAADEPEPDAEGGEPSAAKKPEPSAAKKPEPSAAEKPEAAAEKAEPAAEKAEPEQAEPGRQADRDDERDAEQPRARAEQEPSGADDAAEPRADADRGDGEGRRRPEGRGEGRLKISPLARRLAEESDLDVSAIEGTGPGGRITKRDIEAALGDDSARGRAERPSQEPERAAQEPERAAKEPERPAAPTAAATPAGRGGPDTEEVPVSQMRKTIAKRLVQSIGPVPTFYLTIEVDMTRMLEVRERVNERLEKEGVKASINDFIVKAVAAALARHPEVNASWTDSAMVRHHRVHVGIAVAVEDGLITPVVRDADVKRVRDIAVEIKEMAARAREKKLKPDEYMGATFSISNLGMFGITEFTAIINPPEAGIIAIGAVEQKPVVENGDVVVRPRMRLTMSCDHRIVDGATGAKFLQTVQDLLEEPMMIVA